MTPPEWVAGLGPCVVCGSTLDVQGHHAIPKRVLRALGLGAYLWDIRNRVPVDRRHHERHENRTQPLTRDHLPAAAWEFAAEHGLEWYLDRHYPFACSVDESGGLRDA